MKSGIIGTVPILRSARPLRWRRVFRRPNTATLPNCVLASFGATANGRRGTGNPMKEALLQSPTDLIAGGSVPIIP
jgi:hypothetical protein